MTVNYDEFNELAGQLDYQESLLDSPECTLELLVDLCKQQNEIIKQMLNQVEMNQYNINYLDLAKKSIALTKQEKNEICIKIETSILEYKIDDVKLPKHLTDWKDMLACELADVFGEEIIAKLSVNDDSRNQEIIGYINYVCDRMGICGREFDAVQKSMKVVN